METKPDERGGGSERTAFAFHPELPDDLLFEIATQIEALGHSLRIVDRGHTLEEIQVRLRTVGPSAYLRTTRVSEDISPKAPPAVARRLVAERLSLLRPLDELLIIDPYLMTSARKNDPDVYAHEACALIGPLMVDARALRLVVSGKHSHGAVRTSLLEELLLVSDRLTVDVVETEDFHDRFWIADRRRGVVMGTSLNGIGSKIFLIDDLSHADLQAVLAEVDTSTHPGR